MRLAAPQETLRIIGRYGLHPKKKYGQNFLISEDVVYGILDAAGVTKEDCVLEIGPGIGAMTGYLSEGRAKSSASRSTGASRRSTRRRSPTART